MQLNLTREENLGSKKGPHYKIYGIASLKKNTRTLETKYDTVSGCNIWDHVIMKSNTELTFWHMFLTALYQKWYHHETVSKELLEYICSYTDNLIPQSITVHVNEFALYRYKF